MSKSSLPPVRLHDLRHGAATQMLLEGSELKTIADQLGHSSVVLTADTCLSVAVELGQKVAAAAARLVMKAGKSPVGADNLVTAVDLVFPCRTTDGEVRYPAAGEPGNPALSRRPRPSPEPGSAGRL